MLAALSWKKIPIFISSTFRDMHAERDHLMRVVFPELQERLRKHRCYIEPIDLRWGLETSSIAEVEAKNLRILQVCADEIERSRPFQIVLLGDRYGMVPPADLLASATERAGLHKDFEGLSVTAFEIELGIRSADQCCLVYCRDSLSLDGVPAQTAALFADENIIAVDRLRALKEQLRQQYPDRFSNYSATLDARRQRITGLESFGRRVTEDLWRELEPRVAQHTADSPKTWEERQIWQMDESNSDHLRQFVGRVELLAQLRAFAIGSAGVWGWCLVGESGCGKSAILAKLANELRVEPVLVLVHCVEAVENGDSISLLLRRWIRQLGEFLGDSTELRDDGSTERLDEHFAYLLMNAAERVRVVVLLDAIDQFEPSDRGRFLTWLPRAWPGNARLVAACQPGDASWTLQGLEGCRVEPVPDLSSAATGAVIDVICAKYHRIPDDEVRALLLDRRNADGLPAHANPLWLTLVTEYINALEADDYLQADADVAHTPEQGLLGVLRNAVNQAPADLSSAYRWLLGKAQKRHGDDALLFASLFCISDVGWRNADLQKLMANFTGKEWPELELALLRRTFKQYLAESAEGHWDLRHGYMQLAIREIEMPVPTARLHTGAADYLESLPEDDPIRSAALMPHYLGAGDFQRAARYFSSQIGEQEVQYAVRALARSVIARKSDIEWLDALLGADSLDRASRLRLALRLQEGLLTELARAGETGTRAEVIGLLCKFWMGRVAEQPSNIRSLVECARSMVDLASAHRDLGNIATALTKYQQALAVLERVLRAQPAPLSGRSLATALAEDRGLEGPQDDALLARAAQLAAASHCGIGDLLAMEGNLTLDGAQGQYTMAASVKQSARTEQSLSGEHPLRHNVETALLMMRIGYSLLLMGSGNGAIGQFRFALDQLKQFSALDPSNIAVRRETALLVARQSQALLWESAPGAAALSSGEAIELMNDLVRRDPSRRSWQIDLAYFHLWHGDALDRLGLGVAARLQFRKAHDLAARIASADPDNRQWQDALRDIRRRPVPPLDQEPAAETSKPSFQWDYDPLSGMSKVQTSDGNFVYAASTNSLTADVKTLDPIEVARRKAEVRSGPRFNDWQASLGGAQLAMHDALAGASVTFPQKLAQLRRDAQAHDPNAAWQLGMIYMRGSGIPRDAELAKRWLSQSAEEGFVWAQYNLGVLLSSDEDGLQDLSAAVRWWRLAADAGMPEAQYNLGEACSRGAGTELDAGQAAEWMRKAANQGFAPAQYNLAIYLVSGFGLASNPAAAADWYRRAADQDFVEAKHNLAFLYFEGSGVPQDLEQGLDWLRQAAESRLPASQFALAGYYFHGQGVEKDQARALALITDAAKAGFEPACRALQAFQDG
jgi:TPR repeat protein